LAERAGAEAEPVVQVMQVQHGVLDKLLDELRTGLADWRGTAAATLGASLADTAAVLHERLVEHLATEEDRALPLIERHITAAEWGAMIADGAGDVDPAQIPLIFGMMAHDTDPDTVRDIIAQLPPEVGGVLGDLAAQAYAAHVRKVYGTR
jgi:hypothetical protein